MNNSTKNLLSFMLGAAVGAGVVYLLVSDDGDELFTEIKNKVNKIKEEFGDELAKGKEFLAALTETDETPDVS